MWGIVYMLNLMVRIRKLPEPMEWKEQALNPSVRLIASYSTQICQHPLNMSMIYYILLGVCNQKIVKLTSDFVCSLQTVIN